jgi:hypothetical protein
MLAAMNFGGQNRGRPAKRGESGATRSGDSIMPLRNPSGWWRRTRLRSWFTAAIIGALTAAAAWFAGNPGGAKLFSLPLAQLLAVIIFPFALAFAVHWLALKQEKLDRDFSVWEGR